MENYRIIRPQASGTFAEALESVVRQLEVFLGEESGKSRLPVYVRFYLSDAQNQAEALKDRLGSCGKGVRTGDSRTGVPLCDTDRPFARSGENISIVEQPPLDGSRIAALVRTSDEAERYIFHSIRLTEAEAAGKDSYTQTRLLFGKYLDIIRPAGLELKTHCIRTWIYVRDIDSNYAGVVKARNDVFAEEGLVDHYIASTGIGGASGTRSAVVAMDFLTEPGISEADKTYLKALSHLSPTRDYGVAFERGVKVGGMSPAGSHIYISGTASIDNRGRILHEGDVLSQTDRLLENIGALLSEGVGKDGISLAGIPSATGRVARLSTPKKCNFSGAPDTVPQEEPGTGIARPQSQSAAGGAENDSGVGEGVMGVPYFVIYLRDISDYAKIDAYMQARFPGVPRIVLEARVCRPGWLIEMECEALFPETA